MPQGSEFCAECGAPLIDAPGVQGSDAEVYPELAKANLARMRKEWKHGEDICLAILRRFPNNHSANTLLGDIAAEKGDLDQAAEWYELALDIVPDDAETRQKLEAARLEVQSRQTQATVETLGIPSKRFPLALYAMIGIVVVAFGVAAVLMLNRPRETGPDPNRPIVLEDRKSPPNNDPATVKSDTPTEEYQVDEDLAMKIASEARLEGRTLTASVASLTGDVRLVLHAVGTDGEWISRAKAVMAAFKLRSDAPKVEVQYVTSADSTPESHTVDRATYEKTQAADFDVTDEALLVLTLLGHTLEQPTPADEGTAPNNTVTPPLGDGGDKSSDVDDKASGG